MPKQDCKYWDKCYQQNDNHLQKYNHPKKSSLSAGENSKEEVENMPKAGVPDAKDNREVDQITSTNKPGTAVASPTAPADDESAIDGKRSPATSRSEIDTKDLRQEALKNIAGKNYFEIFQKRVRLSAQMEYDNLLESNEFIRHKFLVEMPNEFYAFWKFISELRPNNTGEKVLEYFEKQYQLQLVGPFEFLAERFHKATIHEPGDYLRHWRFYYDPPEFQTVFVKKGSGVHYGYWRDEPSEKDKLLIARNDASKNCEFEFIASNSFDALRHFLEHDFASTPFSAASIASTKKAISKFLSSHEDLKLEAFEGILKHRNAKVVSKTFHRAGIVVPFVSKTQLGYRPLIVSDADLKKILKMFEAAGGKDEDGTLKTAVTEKLLPIATAANIALDECDFGTSLELGIDLFCSGRPELHDLAQSLLVPAYTLLERPQFIAIAKAHMEQRRRSLNLSIFELDISEGNN